MELWCDIFNKNLLQLRNGLVARPGLQCKMSIDVLWKTPCVVLMSIDGRQLQCSTSPKEQIALPTKIAFWSWQRLG
jgi:hypothetical protein